MASPAQDSDATIAAAGRVLADQRGGGRRLVTGPAIGRHSRDLRRRNAVARLARMAGGAGAVLIAAIVIGVAIGGIGFVGMLLTALALLAVAALTLRYPRLTVPSRENLTRGPITGMVGNTQLWLEAQRPALPAPAVQLVDRIGGQLDVLNRQLVGLDDSQAGSQSVVGEVRRLVGEHLPGIVAAYTAIPQPLRGEARGGTTPDAQVAASLDQISGEIDSVTRALADGALDQLAVQTRYLDYRYGGALTADATPLPAIPGPPKEPA